MATYLELFELRSDSDLQDRTAVAVAIKAQTLIDAGNMTDNAKTWVDAALSSPSAQARELLNYILAANKSASTTVIQSATDSALQTNVSDAVDALIA